MPISRITDLRRVAGRDDVARERRQADRREHAREGEQHGEPGGDERAERDQQDQQRHRQRRVLGPLEVLVQRLVQLVRRAREAELGHREPGMPVPGRARRRRGPAAPSCRPCPHRRGSRTGRAPSGRRSRAGRCSRAASGERTRSTCGSAETVRTTSATARGSRVARCVCVFDWTSTLSPALSGKPARCRGSARPSWCRPAAVSACFSIFVPATAPSATASDAEREPGGDRRLPVLRAPSAARAAIFALISAPDLSTPSSDITVPARPRLANGASPTFVRYGNPYLTPPRRCR